jgi:hypothetical protein
METLLKALGWTLLVVVGGFAVLLGFHFFGVGPTLAVAFMLLAIVWLRWGRVYDRRWREQRGLSHNARERWQQVTGKPLPSDEPAPLHPFARQR